MSWNTPVVLLIAIIALQPAGCGSNDTATNSTRPKDAGNPPPPPPPVSVSDAPDTQSQTDARTDTTEEPVSAGVFDFSKSTTENPYENLDGKEMRKRITEQTLKTLPGEVNTKPK